ncbi:MAG: YqaJ viral recombinase family protein [Phycisphaerales bacterium]|nr:YqaJ viral recombinase family protein [Phycisphaerales bacterium]
MATETEGAAEAGAELFERDTESHLPENRRALALRGVGASEVAAVLGVDPYRTPFDVWAKKKGLVPKPTEVTGFQEYGHYAERGLVAWYEARHLPPGLALVNTLDAQRTIEGPEPWMFCTPDGLVVPLDVAPLIAANGAVPVDAVVSGIECKRRNHRNMDGWGLKDSDPIDMVPDDVALQACYSMAVLGTKRWHVLADLGGLPPRRYILTRNPDLEAEILPAVEEFVVRYLHGDEEPPREGKSVPAYLARKFREILGDTRQATDEEEALLEEMEATKATLDALEERADSLKVRLQEAIGHHKTLASAVAPGRRAMWYAVAGRKTTDWKALALALGATEAQVEAYTKTGEPSRAFRFFPAK